MIRIRKKITQEEANKKLSEMAAKRTVFRNEFEKYFQFKIFGITFSISIYGKRLFKKKKNKSNFFQCDEILCSDEAIMKRCTNSNNIESKYKKNLEKGISEYLQKHHGRKI